MKIFIIVIAVLIILLLQFILERKAGGRVGADIYPDRQEAEPGEEVKIILELKNTSRIPLGFVRFTVMLPEELDVVSQLKIQKAPPNSVKVQGTVFLWPRQKVSKIIKVSSKSRGYYRFGSVSLETGDFLGLKEHKKDLMFFRSISVYPARLGSIEPEIVLGGIMGDYSVRRFIYEDPVLITGFREYTGREPMKSISWTHSARLGQLMVRELDHTAQMSLSVVMDTDGADADLAEICFSLARSVIEWLKDNNIEYDFFMNTATGGAGSGQHYFAKGMGERHFYGILLKLANALDTVSFSCNELLSRVASRPADILGVIFITPEREAAAEKIYKAIPGSPLRKVHILYAEDYAQTGNRAEQEAAR